MLKRTKNGAPPREANYIRDARLLCEQHYPAIKEEYLLGISLKEILDSRGIGARTRVERMLRDDGVELRNTSNMHTKRSRDKTRSTCLMKYGVDNGAKVKEVREYLRQVNRENKELWQGKRSIVDYILGKAPLPKYSDVFLSYKQECLCVTDANKQTMPNVGVCCYTGIPFDQTRWNGAFSRSIDHNISIIQGFLWGMPPIEIGAIDNLVWCCRIVNSLKRELTGAQFITRGIPERIKYAYQNNLLS